MIRCRIAFSVISMPNLLAKAGASVAGVRAAVHLRKQNFRCRNASANAVFRRRNPSALRQFEGENVSLSKTLGIEKVDRSREECANETNHAVNFVIENLPWYSRKRVQQPPRVDPASGKAARL